MILVIEILLLETVLAKSRYKRILKVKNVKSKANAPFAYNNIQNKLSLYSCNAIMHFTMIAYKIGLIVQKIVQCAENNKNYFDDLVCLYIS